MGVKVVRDQELIDIEIEDMKKGDVFALLDGRVKTCSKEPIYDDDDNCFYVQAGIDLYHELLVSDMKEVNLEKVALKENAKELDYGHKHDLLGREVKIGDKEGEITNILGTQHFEVSFFDLNEGKTSIHFKDIDKYLVPSLEKHKSPDISLSEKLKDAAGRVSKGSDSGSERRADMER